MRIRGTKKLDRQGLIRAARRFNVRPVHTEQLKRGKVVEMESDKALALIARGYATAVTDHVSVDNVNLDDLNVDTEETVTVVETEKGSIPFNDETGDETDTNDDPLKFKEDKEVTL